MRRRDKISCLFYTSMLYIAKFSENFIKIDRNASREDLIRTLCCTKIIYAIPCIDIIWYFADLQKEEFFPTEIFNPHVHYKAHFWTFCLMSLRIPPPQLTLCFLASQPPSIPNLRVYKGYQKSNWTKSRDLVIWSAFLAWSKLYL